MGRQMASACILKGIIYVFCGDDGKGEPLNSIEMISETSLVQNSTATWELILLDFNQNISTNFLTPRFYPAVAPINDIEITIMGG